MKKGFNYERGVWKVLGRVGDLFILNVVFLICCIPIFTIGASKTALYAVAKKMAKNEEGYIIKEFFEQFRENFKKSTVMWLLYLGVSALAVLDLIICNMMSGGFVVAFFKSIMIFTLIILDIVLLYALALQSTFENTIKNTIKNALIMSIGYFPNSVVILAVNLSPFIAVIFFVQYISIEAPLLMFLWFATAAYINSFIFNKIFNRYIEAAPEKVSE